VFVDSTFDGRTPQERTATYTALQAAAALQGFEGEVAAVWEDSSGRMRFIAAQQQHAFFQVAKYSQLRTQINGQIDF